MEYYKSIAEAKKTALPYFPLGFTRYGRDLVAAGFESDGKTYLAVWNLGGELHREIPLAKGTDAVCAYPKSSKVAFSLKNDLLTVDFTEKYQARFFEIK